jgi:hypothetical protein
VSIEITIASAATLVLVLRELLRWRDHRLRKLARRRTRRTDRLLDRDSVE